VIGTSHRPRSGRPWMAGLQKQARWTGL